MTGGRARSRQDWLATASVAMVASALFMAGGFEWIERHLSDLKLSLLRRPASGQVVVVAIDPDSLGALDVWPWPRGYHATVLENLLAAGARRVAFDVDFSSRSVEEEEDAAFRQALHGAGERAVLPVFLQWRAAPHQGADPVVTRPLEGLADDASLATINIQPAGDGLVREYGAGRWLPGGLPPPLAFALLPAPGPLPGVFHIDYGIDPHTIPRVSYRDVLSGTFDAATVAGRAVIVGATALELGDQAAVPVHTALPGPVLQALAFESIVSGRMLARPHPAAVIGLVLMATLAAGLPMQRLVWRAGLIVLAGSSLAIAALSVLIQRFQPVLLDTAPVLASLAGCYGVSLVRRIDQQDIRVWIASMRARHTELRMRHVVENCSEAIVTLDAQGRVETFNRAAESLLGRPAAETIGRRFEDVAPGAAPVPHAPLPHRIELERREGDRRCLEVTVSGFDLDGRPVRVAFLRDVTDTLRHQAALEHQAMHDALTDLPNRTMLRRRMEEVLGEGSGRDRRAALLMLDLDRFKEVNDTLGHATGDLLLRRIAGRLRDCLPPGASIARLGGDEFAVLLPGAGAPEARTASRRLLEALAAPFEIDGMSLHVDGSVGIALSPAHGTEGGQLLQHADVAMYAAKSRRNTFSLYDPVADMNSLRHLTLKGEMRDAIERDLLVLHYQPKVELATGQVAGVEALLRWRHPLHGMLSPAEFIPLAEQSGLIKPLTSWVIREALTQGARWAASGATVPISVNCSARNLLEEDLPATVERLLRATGTPPRQLILELTETALIEDPRRSFRVLERIAAMGVGLSIDDFGTAYSSLDYLRKLPARELKIDRSFVSRIGEDRGDAAIVRAMIRLAQDLGLEAVAEGIESQAVVESLQRLGCDQGQGHFICPPLPPGELRAWLRERVAAGSRATTAVTGVDL